MNVGEICVREVMTAPESATVSAVAALMRERHVGAIVVAMEMDDALRPLGIVTDRDLVVEVLAVGLDPGVITVGDVMGQELVTVGEAESVFEALQRMRRAAVRRMPVVDADGMLVGIVTIDDLIEVMARAHGDMVAIISREQLRENRTRRTRSASNL